MRISSGEITRLMIVGRMRRFNFETTILILFVEIVNGTENADKDSGMM